MRLTLGLTVGLVVVLSLVLSSHAILCLSGSLAQISSLLVIYLISPETGSAVWLQLRKTWGFLCSAKSAGRQPR